MFCFSISSIHLLIYSIKHIQHLFSDNAVPEFVYLLMHLWSLLSCGRTLEWMSKQKYYLLTYLFIFLGPHLWYMEVPRLGVESELQLPAYATATTMQDPSHICNLHYSSWQRRILNPPSEARDWTHVLWIPVRFITTEPQGELQFIIYLFQIVYTDKSFDSIVWGLN